MIVLWLRDLLLALSFLRKLKPFCPSGSLIKYRIFEAAIIIFNVFQSGNNASIAASGGPNLTVGNAIIDICLFIPGVTASLITFAVFGTTKSVSVNGSFDFRYPFLPQVLLYIAQDQKILSLKNP
jgi:hypothetical protein